MTCLLQLGAVRARRRQQHADGDADEDEGDCGRARPWRLSAQRQRAHQRGCALRRRQMSRGPEQPCGHAGLHYADALSVLGRLRGICMHDRRSWGGT